MTKVRYIKKLNKCFDNYELYLNYKGKLIPISPINFEKGKLIFNMKKNNEK